MSACGGAAVSRVPVTVYTEDRAVRTAIEETALAVEPTFAELDRTAEGAASEAMDAFGTAIAAARAHWQAARTTECLDVLPALETLAPLIAAGDRATAGRVLFWRAACAASGPDPQLAAAPAQALAAMHLVVPAEVDRMNPNVEAALGEAAEAVAARARAVTTIEAGDAPLRVWIDGASEPACVTPCRVSLVEGPHVIAARGDGYVDHHQMTVVGASASRIEIRPRRASSAVAAGQWRARYRNAEDADSQASLALLAMALNTTQNLIYVRSDAEGDAVRLRAVVADRGAVQGRGERPRVARAELAAHVDSLLLEVLEQAGVVETGPPTLERPETWLLVGLGVLLAAGATTLALIDYPVTARPRFEAGEIITP